MISIGLDNCELTYEVSFTFDFKTERELACSMAVFCILHGSGKYIYCKIRDKEMILFVLIDFILFLFITCFQ